MDKLQWFKFTPTDWIMGKIQRCPEITQARFMRLICLYWNKECVLSYEDAEIEIDKEHLDVLINKKIIKYDNDFICIDFLNEQFKEIECSKEDKSTSAKIGNLKRWHRTIYDRFVKNEFNLEQALLLAYQSQPDSDTITEQSQTIAEKSREELEKEKKRKEDNNKALPFSFFNSMINYGFKKELVSEWIKVRKNKKLTNTETSFKNFIKEVEKTNDDINNVLTECIVKSWGGFKSEWYKKDSLLNSTEKKKYEVSNAFGKEVVFLTDLEFAEKSKQNFNTYKLLY